MHFFDVRANFLGGWAIVGGHLALAAGAAFKSASTTGDGPGDDLFLRRRAPPTSVAFTRR